ncbi:MAG: PDZ domain-containing protein [Candidatus Zixiibacteriota bacterium]|nr:MAG: PDZ domain-containing protein [candidate division Zixibacteria bacterium]
MRSFSIWRNLMAVRSFSSRSRSGRGVRIAAGVFMAMCFVLIGLLISSNLDLSPVSIADTPTNIAQTGPFPVVEYDGQQVSPFVPVVEKVQNAVVNISSQTRNDDIPWWAHPSITQTSSGSGFFFRDDGYILTNSHVVKDAVEITVRTATGYDYEAELVGIDPQTDLAVLKVDPQEKITTIPFGNSDNIRVGDWAIAIGNPFPQQGLDRTVTVGVISAVGRSKLRFGRQTPRYQNYIQTDAAINPGNSGGPLLNLKGECIGVNAAISSPTGSSVGIGFAIPINLARAVVPDLIASGKVSRGWLGVWLADVTERDARREGLDAVRGVRIDSVFAGSPADKAGLRRGDIVVSFNRQQVLNTNQFMVLVSTTKGGSKTPLEIVRNGKPLRLVATIADQDAVFASATGTSPRIKIPGSAEWAGMQLATFTKEIADQLGIEFLKGGGVYVTGVTAGSPADRASITEGTVILQIKDTEVKTVEQLMAYVKNLSAQKVPLIVQEPDGGLGRVVLRLP